MKKSKCTLITNILLLNGVVCLFSSCDSRPSHNDNYEIVHYVDTVNNHIILTTVCDGGYARLSVSTLDITD